MISPQTTHKQCKNSFKNWGKFSVFEILSSSESVELA